MAENETNPEGGKTVYVDDQPVTVEESELTIRRLLELAGTPADTGGDGEAVLRELRGGKEIRHEDLEATITVSEEARFYTRGTPIGGERSEGSFKSESANLETGTRPKTGDVNTSSFGGSRGERGGQGGQPRSETAGGFQANPSGSSPNVSKEQQRNPNAGGQQQTPGQRSPNVSGAPQPSGGNVGGRVPTPDTSTQRGSTAGSNVASGTGVRRDTESSNRGTIPGQGVQNPKTGGQQGSSIQGAKSVGAGTEQTRQGFNEGENQQQGSRRSGERPEGRPGEKKKEEQKT